MLLARRLLLPRLLERLERRLDLGAQRRLRRRVLGLGDWGRSGAAPGLESLDLRLEPLDLRLERRDLGAQALDLRLLGGVGSGDLAGGNGGDLGGGHLVSLLGTGVRNNC